MITSEVQARAVQARRFKAGKTGVSKAVRRWMRRNGHRYLPKNISTPRKVIIPSEPAAAASE
jgi:predicted GTPase